VTNRSKLLDNYPLVRTRHVEEMQAALAKVYARPTLQTAPGVRALDVRINHCGLRHVALGYGGYGAAVSMEFPATDFFLRLFPLRGKGEIIVDKMTIPLRAGGGATIPAQVGYQANFGDDYEHLVLRIPAQALIEKLAAMTGAAINDPLRLNLAHNIRQPAAQVLRHYFLRLVEELSVAVSPLAAWASAQAEQLLMTLFLFGHRHNYSDLLERRRDVAPWQMRLMEEHLAAH